MTLGADLIRFGDFVTAHFIKDVLDGFYAFRILKKIAEGIAVNFSCQAVILDTNGLKVYIMAAYESEAGNPGCVSQSKIWTSKSMTHLPCPLRTIPRAIKRS